MPGADPNHIFVFLGGCTNSGTGLFRAIIGRHPAVAALPQEGPKLSHVLPDDDRRGLPPRLFALHPSVYRLTEADLRRTDFQQVLRDWAPHWDLSKPVLFEKCPANVVRMRFLQAAVPNARFIGLVRHPHAVCEGIRRRRGHDLTLCARQWAEANRIMLEDAESLRRFLLVRYEDLTASPVETVARVCTFIGITPVPLRSDEVWERQNVTNEPQPIRDLNALSAQALTPSEKTVIDGICWPLAGRFGYDLASE